MCNCVGKDLASRRTIALPRLIRSQLRRDIYGDATYNILSVRLLVTAIYFKTLKYAELVRDEDEEEHRSDIEVGMPRYRVPKIEYPKPMRALSRFSA